jgi:hypothetical protein
MNIQKKQLIEIGRVLWKPFQSWTSYDCLTIGIAALLLGLMARHILDSEFGYNILALPGHLFIAVGLWRVFIKEDY